MANPEPTLFGCLTRIEANIINEFRKQAGAGRTPHRGYLNTIEAAKLMAVSPKLLEQWRREGLGPAYVKLGRVVRYDVNEIVAYMERHRIAPLGGDE